MAGGGIVVSTCSGSLHPAPIHPPAIIHLAHRRGRCRVPPPQHHQGPPAAPYLKLCCLGGQAQNFVRRAGRTHSDGSLLGLHTPPARSSCTRPTQLQQPTAGSCCTRPAQLQLAGCQPHHVQLYLLLRGVGWGTGACTAVRLRGGRRGRY